MDAGEIRVARSNDRVELSLRSLGDVGSALARRLGASGIRFHDDDVPTGELERPGVDPGKAELEHAPGPVSQQLEDPRRRGRGESGRQPVHVLTLDGVVEQRQLHAVRSAQARIAPAPGRHDGWSLRRRPGGEQPLGDAVEIVCLDCEPHRARNAVARLDPVDALGLALVEELERRVACLQEDDAAVVSAPVRDLLESERIPVEGDGSVEVRHGQDDAQLHAFPNDARGRKHPGARVDALVARCITIAGSDSGGGAGIQADLKAFAAAGVHGMSAIVALTAQNTREVTAVHEVPVSFVRAQLDAVAGDIGIDAAKTGMLFSRAIIGGVADWLEENPVPLVVDPVLVASSGARLLADDDVDVLVGRLFPLATVVTPNLLEARALTGADGSPEELAVALVELGAPAALVTGGHGAEPSDHLFDGREHHEIPFERSKVAATHGAGCTHSATLAALLARGLPLLDAARGASAAASRAVAQGVVGIGEGDGPVDILGLLAR